MGRKGALKLLQNLSATEQANERIAESKTGTRERITKVIKGKLIKSRIKKNKVSIHKITSFHKRTPRNSIITKKPPAGK